MSVILCGPTALEWLRAVPPTVWDIPPLDREVDLAREHTDFREAARLDLASVGVERRPLHVLVPRGHHRSESVLVRSHETSLATLPAGLVYQAIPGVLVCGPELTFFQLAHKQSLVGATVLGCELTARYSHFSKLISGFYERPALTSIDRLREAMAQLRGLYGLAAARRALALVLQGSRSPMETALACELSFPAAMGGCGFARPQLNYEVELDDVAARILGQRHCYPDIAWKDQQVGVEYDSDEWHHDKDWDHRRSEALSHTGWSTYTVDLDQIHEPSELAKTVDFLDGLVPRHGSPDHAQQLQLHEKLLKATRFGLGLEAALFPFAPPAGRIKIHCHS